MFYDNYIALCAKNKKSASGVARDIGLSNAAANGWKKGKVPNDITLAKLADYFGVPVSELMEGKETSPSAAYAAPRDDVSKIFDCLNGALVAGGFLQDGEDLTEKQAEILLGICKILCAAFEEEH